jgi:hypothetical protein
MREVFTFDSQADAYLRLLRTLVPVPERAPLRVAANEERAPVEVAAKQI